MERWDWMQNVDWFLLIILQLECLQLGNDCLSYDETIVGMSLLSLSHQLSCTFINFEPVQILMWVNSSDTLINSHTLVRPEATTVDITLIQTLVYRFLILTLNLLIYGTWSCLTVVTTGISSRSAYWIHRLCYSVAIWPSFWLISALWNSKKRYCLCPNVYSREWALIFLPPSVIPVTKSLEYNVQGISLIVALENFDNDT